MPHPPIDPIPQLASWADTLSQLASQPLEFCPDFPAIARQHEAWWHQQNRRPLFLATANTDPSRPITRRLELLDQPQAWLAAKIADLRQTRFYGDTPPSVRVDFGPAMLGGMFGAQVEFGGDTTWTHACIDDAWSNEPDWQLREDNVFWVRLQQLTSLLAGEAHGRFLVCAPDLGGSADVLLNLRGSTGLCLDALERPDRIRRAIEAIYPTWRRAFVTLHQLTLERGVGLISWLLLWSNRPYLPPACDFNFMIGPDEFRAVCWPDIARQTATAGRGCFHLDGVGAARHVDALLEIPELRGIQFVPGTGTPSALPWLGMFAKIQASGRSVQIVCEAHEIPALCDALRPEGLCFWTGGTPAQLAAAWDYLQARYR